jgi:hypothetical protein
MTTLRVAHFQVGEISWATRVSDVELHPAAITTEESSPPCLGRVILSRNDFE